MRRNVEEIRVGQMAIRFLVEGHASGGSVAVFEFDVPSGAKLPGAHSHDAYEEIIYGLEGVVTFTVEGERTDIGPGEVLCIVGERFTASTMFAPLTRRLWPSSRPASSARIISVKWRPSSRLQREDRSISQRSRK